MDEKTRILRDYYTFTIPHISVFVGAVLGLLFVLRISITLALGVFSALYGLMLLIVHAIVYPQFRSNWIYRLGLFGSILLMLVGVFLIYSSL
ncbi:hypothetical protein A3L09_10380 [Thermococcus profundus]|uniref:Uncharacterized protein n=1 Tax=Thermococcus profundus TaxID=49899 RepID=A0A2Z2MI97_THEPR|nr:hypothetical protein [Thermococcus profundus]ASJ03634.1 hypothetical protein A3L09_10380 [Thermococcus profundus]